MAALPTDDRMIRICATAACIVQVPNTIVFGLYPLLAHTGVHSPKYDSPAADTIMAWFCLSHAIVSAVSVPMYFSLVALQRDATITPLSDVRHRIVSTVGLTAGNALLLLLAPVVWVAAQESSSFRLNTSAAYRRLWTINRALFGTWGIVTMIAVGAFVLCGVPWDTHPVVPSLLLLSTTELLMATIGFSQPVRKHLHAWLGRMGTTTEVQAAAGVAALVGMVRPAKALVLARERFCALPFDLLQPNDLSTSTDTGLNQNSVHMKLGQCDAFISHSWSDSGDRKYSALNNWAVNFSALWRRSPFVWLDKACIKQGPEHSISEQLACLPVFLAGCKDVLVLAGPTFCERLWCVVELFTFLKMGGSTERLHVIPILAVDNDGRFVKRGSFVSATLDLHEKSLQAPSNDRRSFGTSNLSLSHVSEKSRQPSLHESVQGDGVAQIRKQFKTFDARMAKCYKAEDRERLLAVIESGFGSFDAFNMLVSGLFDQSAVKSSLRQGSKLRSPFNMAAV